MDRKDFISTLGFSVAAVCTGCLAACSKSGGSTTSPGGGTPPASVNFSVDLNNQLLNVGGCAGEQWRYTGKDCIRQ